MKTSALVMALFLGANAKISAEQKAVVEQIKKEIAGEESLMKSASIDQAKVQIVEGKVQDLVNDVITDVTKQNADEEVLNKALWKKMSTEWPVTNKGVEDAYENAFEGLRDNFSHTKAAGIHNVKINNQDTVIKGFKTAYDKDVAAGEGYMKDLKAHKAAVEAAEKKNMDYEGYVQQGKDIKVAIKEAIDSVKTTAEIEDGTTSLYMRTASADQTKLNKLGESAGEFIEDLTDDMKTYKTKKQALDKALYTKMTTEWKQTNEAVEDAYETAFEGLRDNFNHTQAGGIHHVQVDNQDTVVNAFKTAYEKDVAAGQSYQKDLMNYDIAVKKAQKSSFDIIQLKKDWAQVEQDAVAFRNSIKTTAEIEDGTESLVVVPNASRAEQKKKIKTAVKAVADAIDQIGSDAEDYMEDKKVLDQQLANTAKTTWVKEQKKVDGLYKNAFDMLSENSGVYGTGEWKTMKVKNGDKVVDAFEKAYLADQLKDKNIETTLKNYDQQVKKAQSDNFDKVAIKTKVNKAEIAIKDAIRSLENGAEIEDGTTQLSTTTISVSPADEELINKKINKLGEEIDAFDAKTDISSQIKKEIAIIDAKNGVTTWAKKNNIQGKVEDIVKAIDEKVTVTNAAQDIPTWTENITLEDSVLYSTVFVFAFAAILASISHNIVTAPSKKDTIEFDIESSEMIKVAPAKENKKVIKKTLANIMKKNNAKTTLIQQ